MRALIACLLCLPVVLAFAEEKKEEKKDFEVEFEANKFILRGVLRPSVKTVENLLKEKHLLKSAQKLVEKKLLKDDAYECKEIRNDDKLVGQEFILYINENVEVGMIGKLIEGLPKSALDNLPKEYREKVENALKMIDIVPGNLKLNGSLTITSLLPESGRTAGKDAEIKIAVKVSF